MTECRPPDGTPDGTVCWLRSADGRYMALEWREDMSSPFPLARWAAGYHSFSPFELGNIYDQWRFHSIAEKPTNS